MSVRFILIGIILAIVVVRTCFYYRSTPVRVLADLRLKFSNYSYSRSVKPAPYRPSEEDEFAGIIRQAKEDRGPIGEETQTDLLSSEALDRERMTLRRACEACGEDHTGDCKKEDDPPQEVMPTGELEPLPDPGGNECLDWVNGSGVYEVPPCEGSNTPDRWSPTPEEYSIPSVEEIIGQVEPFWYDPTPVAHRIQAVCDAIETRHSALLDRALTLHKPFALVAVS